MAVPYVLDSNSWCNRLCSRLFEMSQEEVLTDIVLKGNDGVAIPVHSCILSAASPVFANLVTPDVSLFIDTPSSVLLSLCKIIYLGIADEDSSVIEALKLARDFEISMDFTPSDHKAWQVFQDATSQSCSANGDSGAGEVSGMDYSSDVTDAKSVCIKPEFDAKESNMPTETPSQNLQSLPSVENQACQSYGISSTEPGIEKIDHLGQPAAQTQKSPRSSAHAHLGLRNISQDKAIKSQGSVCEPSIVITVKELQESIDTPDNINFFDKAHAKYGYNQLDANRGDDTEGAKVADSNQETPNACVGHHKEPHIVASCTSAEVSKLVTGMSNEALTEPAGGISCEICGLAFTSNDLLSRHIATHGTKRRFQCSECPATFTTSANLCYHNRLKHSGPRPRYRCELCGWTLTKSLKGLQKHMLDAHNAKLSIVKPSSKVQCEVCGKSYSRKVSLNQHMDSAHNNIQHKCQQCGFTTRNKYVLTCHVRRVHNGQDLHRYQCGLCGEKFMRPYQLQEHEQHRHTDPMQWSIACEFCPKRFPTKKKLQVHVHACHNPKGKRKTMVPCPECKQQFTSSTMMEKHLHIVHLKDMACTCPTCGRTFSHPMNLKRHLVRHTTVRNFACQVCKADFYTKEDLQKHEHIHFKEKKFECRYCHKRFLRKIFMEQHERTHTREKPLLCNVCGRAFRCTGNLNSHKRTQHPVEHQHERKMFDNRIQRHITNPAVEEAMEQTEGTPVAHEVVCHMSEVALVEGHETEDLTVVQVTEVGIEGEQEVMLATSVLPR